MTDTLQITCWKYPFSTAAAAHRARNLAKGRRRKSDLDGCLAYSCPICRK